MAVKPIVTTAQIIDEALLRQPSARVEAVDRTITALVRDLHDTMFAADGVGIAAIQIGVPLQVVVVRSMRNRDDDATTRTMVLINPEITHLSAKNIQDFDGCLSIPGFWAETDRADFMRVRYQNRFGRWIDGRFEGYLARVVQHELDHLKGVLYVDHVDDPAKIYKVEEPDEEGHESQALI